VATIRYYVDADLLGVAKLLVGLRADLTYAGDPGGIGCDKRRRDPCTFIDARGPHVTTRRSKPRTPM